MIVLYVFLFLLLVVMAFLIAPFHVVFMYREKASVRIRCLFLSLNALKLFEKISSASAKKDTKKKKSPPAKDTPLPKEKKKASPIGFVEFLGRIIRILSEAVRDLFSVMHIHLKELCVVVSTDDAAKTALCYGGAVQAGYTLLALAQRFSHFHCRSDKLFLSPSFTGEGSRFFIHLDVSVRPIQLIPIVFRAYFQLQDRKDEKNERNSIEASH